MKAINVVKAPAKLGGRKTVTLPEPKWPVVDERDVARVVRVVRSGNWSWTGPEEMAFCKEYAQFVGTRHCVGLANGTVTLQCALQAVGVVPGDEVIVPALTWVATMQAALDIGADVVLADIDPETLCISPAAIEKAVTRRTKAIVPVHLYGCMCDMDAIMKIARQRKLKVVEDAAHQQGSQWRGQGAGGIGDVGSFSFQQSKILTSGEGGAVTCNDEDIYRTIFALKQVGWMPDPAVPFKPGVAPKLVSGNRYCHNYRITEMQAALLRGGLARLTRQTRLRETNAAILAAGLERLGGPLRAARRDPRVTRQAYYAMIFHFDPARAEGLTLAQYRKALEAEGIQFHPTYPPVYRSPLMNLYDATSPLPFRDRATTPDYANLRLPNTERAAEQTALLLAHQHLLSSRKRIHQILDAIAKVNDNLAAIERSFPHGD